MKKRLLVLLAALLLGTWADAYAGAVMNFVGPKSVYAKIGLRSGDEVLEVDGDVPKTAGDVTSLIVGALQKPGEHSVVVRRKGRTLTLPFAGKTN